MKGSQEGLTLVELLVVVIVLGILAAIAIPTFLNQRVQAYRAAAEADLRNVAMEIEDHLVAHSSYPIDQAAFDALIAAAHAEPSSGIVKVGSSVPGLTYAPMAGGYCLTAGHVGIDGGNTVVAAYSGMAPGLLDTPTVDCT